MTHKPLKDSFSPRRLWRSFSCAFRGILLLFSQTPNAVIHALATIVVILLAIYFHITAAEWQMLLLCIALVLSLEAVNSALETLGDEVTKEYSPLIRNAKDLAAGAVLIAAFFAVVIGLIIFIPYL